VNWKDYWDNPEELFVGAMLQWQLIFIMGWSVIPIMILCGLLWRWGGTTGGWKPARWALVPLLVCFCAFMCTKNPWVWLAAPFMVKISPFSYGKSGWLWKWLGNDFLVRSICYGWYTLMFFAGILLGLL
jgi:hypothetical protein